MESRGNYTFFIVYKLICIIVINFHLDPNGVLGFWGFGVLVCVPLGFEAPASAHYE